MPTTPDYLGKRFGRLTVCEKMAERKHGKVMWKCACDCGGFTVTSTGSLTTGNTSSCGCTIKEHAHKMLAIMNKDKLGNCSTPTHASWVSMRNRCDRVSDIGYHNYGGRGISYDLSWSDYQVFLADMGERPKGTTLDRIDTNGNYCKSNCRWATPLQQGRNRRDNFMIEWQGETLCSVEWDERMGFKTGTLYSRVCQCGWSVDRAMTFT